MTDDAAWQDFIKGVKPIKRSAAPERVEPPRRIRVTPRIFVIDRPDVIRPYASALKIGDLSRLDRSVAHKMKQGKLGIEGRIDLHGMTLDEARNSLIRFIMRSYATGRRHILVVTGKGLRSKNEYGATIKTSACTWLEETGVVLAACHATLKDGETGALYIMLRKLKGLS